MRFLRVALRPVSAGLEQPLGHKIGIRYGDKAALTLTKPATGHRISRNLLKVENVFPAGSSRTQTMKTQFSLFAAVLLATAGAASAQIPSQDLPNAANPTSSPPAASDDSKTGKTNRPPAAAMPDTNAPEATGQTRATSEKMEPEMDSVGAGTTAPGAEKK
jgi:hypothetical protein